MASTSARASEQLLSGATRGPQPGPDLGPDPAARRPDSWDCVGGGGARVEGSGSSTGRVERGGRTAGAVSGVCVGGRSKG